MKSILVCIPEGQAHMLAAFLSDAPALQETRDAVLEALVDLRLRQLEQEEKDKADNVVRTLHGVRLTKETVISPGLFYAESVGQVYSACIHDGTFFRGHVVNWQTKTHPNGFRINVWNQHHSKVVKKQYATYDKAVKGLIFYGRKLNAAIAA
jgi:hypothetical protein